MRKIWVCQTCGSLIDPNVGTEGRRCFTCWRVYGLMGTLTPAGILLDPLDVAAVVADEGDKLLAECARSLDILEEKEAG